MTSFSTVFINGIPNAQIEEHSNYITRLKNETDSIPYVVEIQILLAMSKYSKIYTKFAQDSVLLLESPEKEFEGTFNLLIAILKSAPLDSLPSLVQSFVKPLVNKSNNKYCAKQKVFSNLYNSLAPTSSLCYDVFLTIVDTAVRYDEIDVILPELQHLERWVSTEENKPSYELLLKYLATSPMNMPLSADATTQAHHAILIAICPENFFTFEDLFSLHPIHTLKGTPLHDLLSVFLNGDLVTYIQFYASHTQFFADEPTLVHKDNVWKLCLLSLTSLGFSNISRELTYSAIAKKLQVPSENVKMWIIDVIYTGLVEARINQLSETITVYRSIYYVFEREQWEQLGMKLNGWKQSLAEILAVVGNVKLIAASSQGGVVIGASVVMVPEAKVEVATVEA
ncbi:hypothetical protein BC938DRAFT_475557 [Jimgerdemannia flammicorona]|uniref:Eukaryotic translation initiation factor 3 subunit M n=1 Tax=Jimgerdemannia flammicorona TaxID=994334 RepID=A0A433QRI3_9FUNG|nr:hypothetical protein BC938DRAFT_475557 [Jimgerdemannia flammicorona]